MLSANPFLFNYLKHAKDPMFRKRRVAGVGFRPLAIGDQNHNYHVSNTLTWIHAIYISSTYISLIFYTNCVR